MTIMFNRTINKIAAVLAIVFQCQMITPFVAGASEEVFTDITGHWAESDIEYLYSCGIV